MNTAGYIDLLTQADITDSARRQSFQEFVSKPFNEDDLFVVVTELRKRMIPISLGDNAIDTCGTGGTGKKTINTSTLAAFIVAACGVPVAKHGGRSASGNCGSANVLETLGIKLSLPGHEEETIYRELGIVFLFAPNHHPTLTHLASLRREHGKPTIFNLAAPLSNPASIRRQIIGTHSLPHAHMIANVIGRLGTHHSTVVSSETGLDEVAIDAATRCIMIQGGDQTQSLFEPQKFGITLVGAEQIQGGTINENARIFMSVLKGEVSPHQTLALTNAAYTMFGTGYSPDFSEGIDRAIEAVRSGRALRKFEEYRKMSQL
jgi:anthranilate phosphoribosyltransferase